MIVSLCVFVCVCERERVVVCVCVCVCVRERERESKRVRDRECVCLLCVLTRLKYTDRLNNIICWCCPGNEYPFKLSISGTTFFIVGSIVRNAVALTTRNGRCCKKVIKNL